MGLRALCCAHRRLSLPIPQSTISLHISPTFRRRGIPVFGLQLYTRSFLVFACSILCIALLLALYRLKDSEVTPPLSLFESTAFVYLALLTLANAVTTFLQCGFGPCSGYPSLIPDS